jgi:uncharacterized protein DUF4339
MKYHIKRDEKEYGPYALVDLQRYVREGSISPNDLAHSEGMVDWVPVSQIVGDIAVPASAPPRAAVEAAIGTDTVVQESPGWHSFHWALVLLLTFVTCYVFILVWMFVQAIWARKVDPDNKSPILFAVYLGLGFAGAAMSAVPETEAFGGILYLAGVVCAIWGVFEIKSAIEDHCADFDGRQLSGIMAFFFHIWYFQYHFNEIAAGRRRQAGGFGISG